MIFIFMESWTIENENIPIQLLHSKRRFEVLIKGIILYEIITVGLIILLIDSLKP